MYYGSEHRSFEPMSTEMKPMQDQSLADWVQQNQQTPKQQAQGFIEELMFGLSMLQMMPKEQLEKDMQRERFEFAPPRLQQIYSSIDPETKSQLLGLLVKIKKGVESKTGLSLNNYMSQEATAGGPQAKTIIDDVLKLEQAQLSKEASAPKQRPVGKQKPIGTQKAAPLQSKLAFSNEDLTTLALASGLGFVGAKLTENNPLIGGIIGAAAGYYYITK